MRRLTFLQIFLENKTEGTTATLALDWDGEVITYRADGVEPDKAAKVFLETVCENAARMKNAISQAMDDFTKDPQSAFETGIESKDYVGLEIHQIKKETIQ